MSRTESVLLDAGIFIGALLRGDSRHEQALPLVEAARSGDLAGCTTTGILSEVYAALTWIHAQPPHTPKDAAHAVRQLIQPPSFIRVVSEKPETAELMLDLVTRHSLTARRVHDARHAATALAAGISRVITYDLDDWRRFKVDGLEIVTPFP